MKRGIDNILAPHRCDFCGKGLNVPSACDACGSIYCRSCAAPEPDEGGFDCPNQDCNLHPVKEGRTP